MKTSLSNPDLIELVLVIILAIWTVSVFYLLRQASTFAEINLVSWTSLTAFFTGFASITIIVIAIIVADIRKELSR